MQHNALSDGMDHFHHWCCRRPSTHVHLSILTTVAARNWMQHFPVMIDDRNGHLVLLQGDVLEVRSSADIDCGGGAAPCTRLLPGGRSDDDDGGGTLLVPRNITGEALRELLAPYDAHYLLNFVDAPLVFAGFASQEAQARLSPCLLFVPPSFHLSVCLPACPRSPAGLPVGVPTGHSPVWPLPVSVLPYVCLPSSHLPVPSIIHPACVPRWEGKPFRKQHMRWCSMGNRLSDCKYAFDSTIQISFVKSLNWVCAVDIHENPINGCQ
jgi:hypothetical protein